MRYERKADGARRFFPANGTVAEVYLRDKRGRAERGLEPFRDYEIEPGGISLKRVPLAGEVVIIEVGERVVIKGRPPLKNLIVHRHEFLTPPANQFPASAQDPVPAPVAARDRSQDPSDVHELQDVLTLAADDLCRQLPERTAEWQDEFALLTARMRAETTIAGVYSAFDAIEQFLRAPQ